MSHRNHPSRRDLYGYGLKEGEAWGDDRRALEAALWEIDQLERQTEYEYHRPFPSHPRSPARSSTWHPSYHSSGGPHYHDFQITRSNSDSYPSESGMTPLSSQRHHEDSIPFDRYQSGANRTYPSSHAVPSAFRGYPGSQSPMSQSSTTSRDYRQPPHYASPLRPSNSNYQDFRDSNGFSHSSNHHFAPAMAHARSSSYDPSHHPQHSLQHPPAQQRISTPGQLQMVTRGSGRNESFSPEPDVGPRHGLATPAPTMSPRWSMDATEGTARSESMSSISGGMYSQNYGDMGYASRTSGHVESFDVYRGSHGEFYSSDEEYGFANGDDDDGYYSGYAGPEECWENDEGSDGFSNEDDGY